MKGGEKMEDFKEIWLKRPKPIIHAEINQFKTLYATSKSSFKHAKDKAKRNYYLRNKAWYFAGIILRKWLLRKKRLTEKDAEMLRNILFKKYPLSEKYLKTALRNNWYALRAEEENFQKSYESEKNLDY